MSVIEHKTTERLIDYIDTKFCAYCDQRFIDPREFPEELPIIEITQTVDSIFIHKNCVVAFTSRVLNEFEKFENAAKELDPGPQRTML